MLQEEVIGGVGLQEVDTGLDLSGLDQPTDALAQFNLNSIPQLEEQPEGNQATPPVPGEDPPTKKKTMADLQRDYEVSRQKIQRESDYGAMKKASETRGYFQAARTMEFDAQALGVDRYKAYGKDVYNRVGFNPFQDNEKVFNDNTTIFNDYGRMIGNMGSLMYEGAVSGYKSIGSLFSDKDRFFDADAESAKQFAKANYLGMSTRKGMLGGTFSFLNNLTLQLAYTSGVGLSILAEEAALAAVTAATKGVAAPLAAARTAKNWERFISSISKGFDFKSINSVLKGSKDLAQSLSRIENAREFYSGVKTGALAFGKGALKFMNPLSRTTDDVLQIMNNSVSVRNLSNSAKLRKTFGSFYRDMRDINLALAESKLEGGSAQTDKYNELVSKHVEKFGKYPEGEELEKIYAESLDNGYTTTALNFPVILLTNKVTLDGLMKFRGFQSLETASKLAERGIGFKSKVGFFDDVSTGLWKNTVKPFTQPKTYLGKGLSYFKANFAEGIQENMQNITASAVSSYYDELYKDPTRGGLEYALGSAWSGLKNEISGQGIETFLSGFLMGGAMSKGTSILTTHLPNMFYKAKDFVMDTKKVAEYNAEKTKKRGEIVTQLNEIYKDPLKYFNATYESATIQKNADDVMNQSEAQGDAKTFQDAKDLKTFEALHTALQKGTFQNLIDGFRETKKLSGEEISDFFNFGDSEKAHAKLDEIIQRAEGMQERYEKLEKAFPNPFKPAEFPKDSDAYKMQAYGYVAFESAKKSALFAEDSFNRALERVNSVYDDLVSNPPIGKASSLDFNVLRNDVSLGSEIMMLKEELKSLEGMTKEEKKRIKQKEERLEILQEFKDKLDEYRSGIKNPNPSPTNPDNVVMDVDAGKVEDLEAAYRKYLKHLAKVNDDFYRDGRVADSFTKLLDIYKLDVEAQGFNEIVNTLFNPEGFARFQMGLSLHFKNLHENFENDTQERIKRAERLQEINGLVASLMAKGVVIDQEELIDLITNGKRPSKFINSVTNAPIEPDDPLYEEAVAMLDLFEKIDNRQPEQPPSQPPPPTSSGTPQESTTSAAGSATLAGMPVELQDLLKDAYDEHIREYGGEATLDDFVKESSKAKSIIEDYNRKKNQPEEELTPQNFKPESDAESLLINNATFDDAQRNGWSGSFGEFVNDVRETLDKIKTIPDPSIVTRDVVKVVLNSSKALQLIKNEGLIERAIETLLKDYEQFKKGAKSTGPGETAGSTPVVEEVMKKLLPLYNSPLELANELLARMNLLDKKQQEDLAKAPAEEHDAIRERYKIEKANLQERIKPSATAYVDPQTGDVYDRVSSLKGEYTGMDDGGYAANRGTIIDYLLREFIGGKITTLSQLEIAYDNHSLKNQTNEFTRNMLKDLFGIFTEVKESTKDFVIISDIPTLWGDLRGGKYAGTIDLLAINKNNGKVYIIDLKTSSRNRRDVNDAYYQSYKDGDTIQQSAYAELLRQRTGIEVENVNIFPIQLFKANNKFARAMINKDPATNKLTMGVTFDETLFKKTSSVKSESSGDSTPSSDIEAKKADIERRRQEELDNLGQKQLTAAFNRLTEAKTPEEIGNVISIIEVNTNQGAKLSSEQSKQLSSAKEQLKTAGYEIVNKETIDPGDNTLVQTSLPYEGQILTEKQAKRIESSINTMEKAGMEVYVEDLPSLVSRVVNPEIHKDGKMVQAAQVVVIVFDSVEQAKEAIIKSKEVGYKQSKVSDKINAKYDAELAALEGKPAEAPVSDIKVKKADIAKIKELLLGKYEERLKNTKEGNKVVESAWNKIKVGKTYAFVNHRDLLDKLHKDKIFEINVVKVTNNTIDIYRSGYLGSGDIVNKLEEGAKVGRNIVSGINIENGNVFVKTPDSGLDVYEIPDAELAALEGKPAETGDPEVQSNANTGEQIYKALGNKTKSDNIIIKPWSELKDAKKAVRTDGIVSTRIFGDGAALNFGNPFSSDKSLLSKSASLIPVDSTKEAVVRYIDWILTGDIGNAVNLTETPEEFQKRTGRRMLAWEMSKISELKLELDERRDWILENLMSGDLKGKSIFYYKELGEPSHATALDYLINKYDWSQFKKASSTEDSLFDQMLKDFGSDYIDGVDKATIGIANETQTYSDIIDYVKSANLTLPGKIRVLEAAINTYTKNNLPNKEEALNVLNESLQSLQKPQEEEGQTDAADSFTKVNQLLEGVTHLKNIPNLTDVKRNKVAAQILEMVIGDEISMDNAMMLIESKRSQLQNALTTKFFKKGDVVTMKSGRQGKVMKVKSGKSIDVEFPDVANTIQTIMEENLKNEIFSIDKKIVDTRKEEETKPVTEKEKEIMTDSKASLGDFTSDTSRLKQVAQDAAMKAGKDNKENLDDLINNLGCKN